MTQSTNKTLLWIAIAALAVLAIYFYQSQPAGEQQQTGTTEPEPIQIGVITPLTGEGASYGTAMQKSYDLAVEEINSAGGVIGRPLVLVYEDGKCNGKDATTAAQKLINIDQVKVILGGTCSGETLAAAEITQQARTLLISPSATSPDISEAGDLVYRTYPSDTFEADLMVAHATDVLQAETAAVIAENTDFAQGVRNAFINTYEEGDKEIVFDESFNTGETDFRTLLTKLRSVNPDVVYVIPQAPAAGELILKQMNELGIETPRLAANTMLDRDTFEENPSLYEGLVLAEVALNEENTTTSAFLEAYERTYDEAPSFPGFSAAARDSVYLVTEAIRATGTVNAEQIARYFDEQVRDWQGAIGTLNFDENGDAIIELELIRVEDGETVPVVPGSETEDGEPSEEEETTDDSTTEE